jgi:branched-chain amino acid transport system substrate-binding protein
LRKRSWASCGLALAAVLAGCGGGDAPNADATLTVYVSVPASADGRDVADGARMALADANGEAVGTPVTAKILDAWGTGDHWTPAKSAANARTATQDSTAIAYLGDFESGATRASLPVTNKARLLQVSAASGAEDLVALPGTDDLPETQPDTRTFGRVIPSDGVQAEAGAAWVGELKQPARTESDGSEYGDLMVAAFEDALGVSPAPTGAREVLYFGGLPASEPPEPEPGRTLMVTDAQLALADRALATAAALDPSQLPPAGRDFAGDFEARYGRPPGRYAAYGYEAMAVILDSIGRAADPLDRASVVDAFFETTERDSVLGTYSIDELGDTTLDRMTGYELRPAGAPRPIAALEAR